MDFEIYGGFRLKLGKVNSLIQSRERLMCSLLYLHTWVGLTLISTELIPLHGHRKTCPKVSKPPLLWSPSDSSCIEGSSQSCILPKSWILLLHEPCQSQTAALKDWAQNREGKGEGRAGLGAGRTFRIVAWLGGCSPAPGMLSSPGRGSARAPAAPGSPCPAGCCAPWPSAAQPCLETAAPGNELGTARPCLPHAPSTDSRLIPHVGKVGGSMDMSHVHWE